MNVNTVSLVAYSECEYSVITVDNRSTVSLPCVYIEEWVTNRFLKLYNHTAVELP